MNATRLYTSAMKPIHLIPNDTNIRFLQAKWLAFGLSGLLVAASIFLLFTRGLNFGIDFTGGTVMEIRHTEAVELAPLRAILSQQIQGEVTLQNLGTPKDVMIRLAAQGEAEAEQEAQAKVKQLLEEQLGTAPEYRKIDVVGPQVGEELVTAGITALALAFLGMLIYISIRFEWQFGAGAIIALVHDVILTFGFFSLLDLEFSLTSVAAMLTIIGYSINDSVVIYDRIRENLRKFKKMPLAELLDKAINETLSRTILTGGTTLAALVALVWVGTGAIETFSLAVLFGVVIGTYSSIFIAAPVLVLFHPRRKKNLPKATSGV